MGSETYAYVLEREQVDQIEHNAGRLTGEEASRVVEALDPDAWPYIVENAVPLQDSAPEAEMSLGRQLRRGNLQAVTCSIPNAAAQ